VEARSQHAAIVDAPRWPGTRGASRHAASPSRSAAANPFVAERRLRRRQCHHLLVPAGFALLPAVLALGASGLSRMCGLVGALVG